MRYQFPTLGGQLARKLPKFFIQWMLQSSKNISMHMSAVQWNSSDARGPA
jgi:hypothetical protein